MSKTLNFFETPIRLNHFFLLNILKPGHIVLDATCGNGQDTLFLSQQVLQKDKGWVYALDIQKEAIENTQTRLKKNLDTELLKRITLKQSCHSNLSDFAKISFDLIIYNFGYLPGANHELTTTSEASLKSLSQSLDLLKPGAYLSLTCYPGHTEGKGEAREIVRWTESLNSNYICCQHRWINRSEASPFLLIIHRKLKLPS